MDIEAEVDRLYAVAPEEFIAARDTLVRRLRGDGRREEAREVSRRRRPTVAAWAVNQAVRRDRPGVEALREAASSVRHAQQRLLAGVRRSGMDAAARARREAVARLVSAAVAVLKEAGRDPDPTEAAVTGTLEAAVVDPDALEAVAGGRLVKPLEPPAGFGDLAWLTAAPPPTEEPDAEDDTGAEDDTAPDLAEVAAAEEALAAAEEALAAAEQRRDEAQADAARAADELQAARQAAQAAARRVRAAERRDDKARAALTGREQEMAAAAERVAELR